MPVLVAGIPEFQIMKRVEGVDGRAKPDHDGVTVSTSMRQALKVNGNLL